MILLALCLPVEEGDETLGLGGDDKLPELGPLRLVAALRTLVQPSPDNLQGECCGSGSV